MFNYNIQTLALLILLHYVYHNCNALTSDDWMVVEQLAEQFPYFAALLNKEKKYLCSGIVISELVILTSGSCLSPEPTYISVGVAVLDVNYHNNTIYDVDHSVRHPGYSVNLGDYRLENLNMANNLGLVYSSRYIHEIYIVQAYFGEDYLPDSAVPDHLTVVGFGSMYNNLSTVLQYQHYRSEDCKNVGMVNCICAFETKDRTYEADFGGGAPVMNGYKVVAIATIPSGKLHYREKSHNIFTAIKPYLDWISANATVYRLAGVIEPVYNGQYRCTISTYLLSSVIYRLLRDL